MSTPRPLSPQCLMHKAENALASATLLHEAGDVDGACNRAYYAMFDAAKAVLLATVPTIDPQIGKTHNGLIAAFGLHMVKTGLVSIELGRALNRAQSIRQIADYTGDMIEPEDVDKLLTQACEFVFLLKTRWVMKA
jgi:uncharacterized protein (UPF0332 family)